MSSIEASSDALAKAMRLARRIGLTYSSCTERGYSRRKKRRGFEYLTSGGKVIRNDRVLSRTQKLGIPPAWGNVWICRSSLGHLQATGVDEKNRKQYLYHQRWSDASNGRKFSKLLDLGKQLPSLRAQIELDLRRRTPSKTKLAALVVALIDETLIRVGNEEYARENRSFGLTTLRKTHLHMAKNRAIFRFRGKSGISHEITVERQLLISRLKECLRTPGAKLFRFLDSNGDYHTIRSSHVNEYLRITLGAFTAKDLRTWKASVIVAESLAKSLLSHEAANCKASCLRALDRAAESLGNTRTICRKHYVHPFLIDSFTNEEDRFRWKLCASRSRNISRAESLLMRILRQANKQKKE